MLQRLWGCVRYFCIFKIPGVEFFFPVWGTGPAGARLCVAVHQGLVFLVGVRSGCRPVQEGQTGLDRTSGVNF